MRPVSLPFSGWATGNYPAGTDAWSATAKRTAPVNLYLTPNTEAVAQYDNYVMGSVTDTLQGLLDQVGQMQALNFPQTVTKSVLAGAGANTSIIDMHFTEKLQTANASNIELASGAWFVMFTDQSSPGTLLAYSQDNGHTWVQVGNGGNYVSAAGDRGRMGSYADELWFFKPTAFTARKLVWSTGVWTDPALNNTSAGLDVAVLNFSSKLLWVNDKDVCYYGGAAWALGNHNAGAGTYVGAAASPTVACLMRDNCVPVTSPDGITWTAQADFSANTAHGICYSNSLGKFFASVANGTSCEVWSSSDGAAWTLVSTVSKPSWEVAAVCFGNIQAVGSMLVGLNGAFSVGTGCPDLWCSLDGGVTWALAPGFRLAQGTGGGAGGFATDQRPPLMRVGRTAAGQDIQLAVTNGVTAYFSQVTGKP